MSDVGDLGASGMSANGNASVSPNGRYEFCLPGERNI